MLFQKYIVSSHFDNMLADEYRLQTFVFRLQKKRFQSITVK